jgi:hypothetical protein
MCSWSVGLDTLVWLTFGVGAGWEHHGCTVGYTAPELLLAARSKPDPKAPPCFTVCGPPVDCWGFGVTALELLTGCCLFRPDFRARPLNARPGSLDHVLWDARYTADLHAEWVCAVPHSQYVQGIALLSRHWSCCQGVLPWSQDDHPMSICGSPC